MNDEVLEAYGRKKLDDYTHWVYVLTCHSHFRTYDELERKVDKRLSYKPNWLREAFEASYLYYVGQTENLEKRLGQHFQKSNASDFTILFDPSDIEYLKPVYSRNSAEFKEQKIRKNYNESDDVFAYSA